MVISWENQLSDLGSERVSKGFCKFSKLTDFSHVAFFYLDRHDSEVISWFVLSFQEII